MGKQFNQTVRNAKGESEDTIVKSLYNAYDDNRKTDDSKCAKKSRRKAARIG